MRDVIDGHAKGTDDVDKRLSHLSASASCCCVWGVCLLGNATLLPFVNCDNIACTHTSLYTYIKNNVMYIQVFDLFSVCQVKLARSYAEPFLDQIWVSHVNSSEILDWHYR